MGGLPVVGAAAAYERAIHAAVESIPAWYRDPARVRQLVVTPDPKVREQVCMYMHGTRDVLVAPGIGNLLQRALAHEFAHGFDDTSELPGGAPHMFSASPEWISIHRSATRFELPKYRDDPREYFADMAAKALLLGLDRVAVAASQEARYIGGFVFPAIRRYAGT